MNKLSVKAIRVNMGLTQAAMAEKIGVDLSRYGKIERGDSKMYATELLNICSASGVDIQQVSLK